MLALATCLALQLARPPFHQTWSIPGTTFDRRLGLFGSVYVSAGQDQIQARDLATGKTVWTHPLPKGKAAESCPSDPGTLYCLIFAPVPQAPWSAIARLDPATGKTLAYRRMDINLSCRIEGNLLYAIDHRLRLTVTDLAKSQPIWSTALSPRKGNWTISTPLLTPNKVVVEVQDDPKGDKTRILGLDRQTGKIAWSRPCDLDPGDLPMFINNTVIAEEGGIEGLDPDTGKRKWFVNGPISFGSTAVVGDELVGALSDAVIEVEAGTGKVLWHYAVNSGGPVTVAQAPNCVLVSADRLYALTLDGKEIWKTSDIEGEVLWSDADHIVTDALSGTLSYETGPRPTVPATPTERYALAVEFCHRLTTLDETDKKTLVELGEPAYEPLLTATIALAKQTDKVGVGTNDLLMDELPAMLAKVLPASKVPDLLRMVRSFPVNHWVGMELGPAAMISGQVSPKDTVTLCLWIVHQTPPTAWPRDESTTALAYLRQSPDPRAKRYIKTYDRSHRRRRR